MNDVLLVRHIPEWIPWFSYKPLARFGYNLGQEVVHEPMRFVKESIVSKTVYACVKVDYTSLSRMALLNTRLR